MPIGIRFYHSRKPFGTQIMKPYLLGALALPPIVALWIGLGHLIGTAIDYSKMGGGY
jgi:hypothetical protein